MTQYKDFSIQISEGPGGQLRRQLLQSPVGSSSALPFERPFDAPGTESVLSALGRYRDAWRVTASKKLDVKDIGSRLFRALFDGQIGNMYYGSRGNESDDNAIRIKLHIDLKNDALAPLANLPWEMLYDPDKQEFLNLNTQTPIVRYLEVPSPVDAVPIDGPIRVLVLLANPPGTGELDLEKERQKIEEIWKNQPNVQVEFVQGTTLVGLRDRLMNNAFQVLHYSGHGSFDAESGKGVLQLEDENGQLMNVSGEQMRVCLRGTDVQFVFLNACRTAISPKDAKMDPFAGVASALVLEGIPAVVAMQFPITDDAAIIFSGTLYQHLAAGASVEEAIAEGRVAIRLANSEEWATPALFSRSESGVIFSRKEAAEASKPAVPIPPPGEPSPEAEAIVEKVRDLVGNDKLEKALQLLEEKLKDKNPDLYNLALDKRRELKKAKREMRMNLISDSDESRTRSKASIFILNDLLEMAEGYL